MNQSKTAQKTRKKLMDSFWQLYREKGMQKVTVGSVTRLAGLNRGTFYEYFTDLYDLLEQLEADLLTEIRFEIEENFADGFSNEFQSFSQICAHIFSLYDDKIYVLLSAQGDRAFTDKLKEWLEPTLVSLFHFSELDIPSEYIANYIFSVVIGMLNFWYENGQKISIERLFEMSHSLILNGVLGYTKINVFE